MVVVVVVTRRRRRRQTMKMKLCKAHRGAGPFIKDEWFQANIDNGKMHRTAAYPIQHHHRWLGRLPLPVPLPCYFIASTDHRHDPYCHQIEKKKKRKFPFRQMKLHIFEFVRAGAGAGPRRRIQSSNIQYVTHTTCARFRS